MATLYLLPGRWQSVLLLCIIASPDWCQDLITLNVEHHYQVHDESMKPKEILHRLNAQYGEETISCAGVWDWYSKFSEAHEVLHLPLAHIVLMFLSDICTGLNLAENTFLQ